MKGACAYATDCADCGPGDPRFVSPPPPGSYPSLPPGVEKPLCARLKTMTRIESPGFCYGLKGAPDLKRQADPAACESTYQFHPKHGGLHPCVYDREQQKCMESEEQITCDECPQLLECLDGSNVVDEINRRFREGIPSNSLATAGVLVHEFDKLEDWEHDQPWKTCSKSSENSWCTDQAKHESCTLINKDLPHLFVEAPNTAADDPSDGSMGFILSPRVTEILCSFYADGGTQGQPDGGCFHTLHDGIKKPVPKCNPQPAGCDQAQFNAKAGVILPAVGCGRYWNCAFVGTEMLGDMMRTQQRENSGKYNEVVVSSKFWDDHLPGIIEAVFFISTEEKARAVHRNFLAAYGKTRHEVPLVQYNAWDQRRPFREVE